MGLCIPSPALASHRPSFDIVNALTQEVCPVSFLQMNICVNRCIFINPRSLNLEYGKPFARSVSTAVRLDETEGTFLKESCGTHRRGFLS